MTNTTIGSGIRAMLAAGILVAAGCSNNGGSSGGGGGGGGATASSASMASSQYAPAKGYPGTKYKHDTGRSIIRKPDTKNK
jgi:hypothetical protein